MSCEKILTVGNIIIGDEILKGYVKETNSHFLAKQCFPKGLKLERILVLPDEEEIIAKSVAEFSEKYDYVVTSGGIGPTHDDITFDSVAKAFNEKLGVHYFYAELNAKMSSIYLYIIKFFGSKFEDFQIFNRYFYP